MKKIEIITKNGQKKKSQVIKPKTKADLSTAFGLVNFMLVKDGLNDLDLTSSVTFKVDGEKINPRQLAKLIQKEMKSDDNDTSNKNYKDGRLVIHSRAKAVKENDKSDKKNKKKKKKDKKKDKKLVSKPKNVISKKKKKKKGWK